MLRRRSLVAVLVFLGPVAFAAHPAQAAPVSFADDTAARGLLEPLKGMYAHAAAFGDVNRDGWQDLFVGTFANYPDANYQVRGATGPATDRLLLGGPSGFTPDAGFPGTHGVTAGATFADLDNDGWPDLVISRYTQPGTPRGDAASVVLRNVGGSFVDGPALPPLHRARAAAAFDYDGDGLLDLFMSDDWFFGGGASVLLRNRGGLAFEDVTARAQLSGIQGFGASVVDLTADGWPDLVVAGTTVHADASTPAARLFVNSRNGTFREAPNAMFTWRTFASEDDPTGVTAGDLNRDGRPDLVIGQHFQSTLQRGTVAPIHAYLNRGLDAAGNPRFEDVTDASGLPALATKSPDVQVVDFDNDGWPDILTSASSAGGTRPTVFRNLGLVGDVPRFETPPGLGAAQYWVNSAVADVDRDGRVDVFVTDFDPARPSLLFVNGAPAGRWLDVSVAGPGQGAGSRVEVFAAGHLGDPAGLLGMEEITTSTGYTTGRPPVAHFGLGGATTVDVRVIAPRSGATVSAAGVGVNRTLEMRVDAAPAPAPPPGDAPLVETFTPTRLRQDFAGWVGMQVRVGPNPLTVSALGRWVVAGSTGDHAVKLVRAASRADVAGGAATVSTASAPGGAFRYAPLASPVTLLAGEVYFLVSEEKVGGDAWYDYDTATVTSAVASDIGVVYSPAGSPGDWVTAGGAGQAYGPTSLLYTAGGPAPPTTATTATTATTSSTTTSSTTTTSATTSTSVAATTTTSTTAAPTTTAAPAPAGAAGTPLVQSFTPSRLRSDFSGWVGMQVRVGTADLSVSALGRWVVAGNTASHRVKLVEAATGADVPGASVSVATSGAPAGAFRYTTLARPVTLRAGATYHLVSEESAGGDAWYDYDLHLTTTGGATVPGVVYAFPQGSGWITGGGPGQAFGPSSLLYGAGSAATTAPATTTTGAPATTVPAPAPTTTTPATTTVAPAAGGTPLVTSFTQTHLRRDFSGWVGMQLRVGASPLRVTALGRWVVAGSTGTHVVKLVDAASGSDVAGASVTVVTAGAATSSFRFVALPEPVTLRAGAAYYLVSEETAGGDSWYDYDTGVVTTGAATVPGAVYRLPAGGSGWVVGGSGGNAYGPPNLLST